MKKNILPLLSGVAVAGLVTLASCNSGPDKAETLKATYEPSNEQPDQLCLVKPSWFPHSQTPAPAEGAGSPFDVASTTNAIFHQWSWNKFLWLTKPDAGGNPLFLNSTKVMQVSTNMNLVTVPQGALVVLQDINQAGSGSPVLQSNPNYAGKSETVYYSIHMNQQMYENGVSFSKLIAKDPKLADNTFAFPVGSFELKVAWIPVTSIPASKRASYYTTTASLSPDGGKTFTNTQVALIGMHVVGVVQNHPEFIWATFEHEDLSPNYDWKNNSASASEDKLLFMKGTTVGINGIRFNTVTRLGYTPYQVFDLFQYGVPRDNTGNFMANISQSEPENFDNIDGINKCVKANLKDVWNNYFYNGSIWLDTDGKSPEEQVAMIKQLQGTIGSATKNSPTRGSLNCANVTMESFTQTFQKSIGDITVNNIANCFSCHKGTSFSVKTNTSALYLSHVFQDYLLKQQGNSTNTIETLKAKDEENTKQMFLKR